MERFADITLLKAEGVECAYFRTIMHFFFSFLTYAHKNKRAAIRNTTPKSPYIISDKSEIIIILRMLNVWRTMPSRWSLMIIMIQVYFKSFCIPYSLKQTGKKIEMK